MLAVRRLASQLCLVAVGYVFCCSFPAFHRSLFAHLETPEHDDEACPLLCSLFGPSGIHPDDSVDLLRLRLTLHCKSKH